MKKITGSGAGSNTEARLRGSGPEGSATLEKTARFANFLIRYAALARTYYQKRLFLKRKITAQRLISREKDEHLDGNKRRKEKRGLREVMEKGERMRREG